MWNGVFSHHSVHVGTSAQEFSCGIRFREAQCLTGSIHGDVPLGQYSFRPPACSCGSVYMPHSCSLSQKLLYADGIDANGRLRALWRIHKAITLQLAHTCAPLSCFEE